VLPRWAHRQLTALSHAEIQAWVAEQASAGMAPATVRRHFRVLSLVLDLAVRDGRMARNPCTGVNVPRAEQARRRYLTHRQVHLLAAETAAVSAGVTSRPLGWAASTSHGGAWR
jgi:site-specific recombinase XerC